MTIYLLGTVLVMIGLGMNPFITSQGFGKIGMMTVGLGAIINIILDPILIFAAGMGVQGAALATVIAQGCSAAWVLGFLTSQRAVLRLRLKNMALRAVRVKAVSYTHLFRRMKNMPCEPEKEGTKIPLFHMTAVKRIAQIGLPSMLQQSLVSLSMMMMQGLVNTFGKVLVAGYTAATKIDTLAMLPLSLIHI